MPFETKNTVGKSANEIQEYVFECLNEIERLNADIASLAEAMDLVFEAEQGSKFDQQEVDAKLDKAYWIIEAVFPDERHDFESSDGTYCRFCGHKEKHPKHYQVIGDNKH